VCVFCARQHVWVKRGEKALDGESVADRWSSLVAAFKAQLPDASAASAPKPSKGWCGSFDKSRGRKVWDKSDAEVCSMVQAWFPSSQAVYTTRSDNLDEHLVHVSFGTEGALVDAMKVEHKEVGHLVRCHGVYGCAHTECQIPELVVLDMGWARSSLVPPVGTHNERRNLVALVSRLVQALSGAPVVDSGWCKPALSGGKAKVYVYLVMHTMSDVEKLCSAEAKLSGFAGSASAVVDVPNSPALQRCAVCKVKGHNDKEMCINVYGAPFAIKAIFNDAVSEIGRREIEALQKTWGSFHSVFTGCRIGAKVPRHLVYLTFPSEQLLFESAPLFLTAYSSFIRNSCVMVGNARTKGCCEECGAFEHSLNQCPLTRRNAKKDYREYAQAAGAPQSGASQSPSPVSTVAGPPMAFGLCWEFVRTGGCRFSPGCRFSHPELANPRQSGVVSAQRFTGANAIPLTRRRFTARSVGSEDSESHQAQSERQAAAFSVGAVVDHKDDDRKASGPGLGSGSGPARADETAPASVPAAPSGSGLGSASVSARVDGTAAASGPADSAGSGHRSGSGSARADETAPASAPAAFAVSGLGSGSGPAARVPSVATPSPKSLSVADAASSASPGATVPSLSQPAVGASLVHPQIPLQANEPEVKRLRGPGPAAVDAELQDMSSLSPVTAVASAGRPGATSLVSVVEDANGAGVAMTLDVSSSQQTGDSFATTRSPSRSSSPTSDRDSSLPSRIKPKAASLPASSSPSSLSNRAKERQRIALTQAKGKGGNLSKAKPPGVSTRSHDR